MKKRILIVDDQPSTLDALGSALRYEGYEILLAGDGAKALETIVSARPDLVLLDWIMPVMSGLDLLQELQALRPACPTRIVLMSAAELPEPARELCAAVVTKPFDLAKLTETLARLLPRSPAPVPCLTRNPRELPARITR